MKLTFDPTVISYREILEVFFTIHNPTTLNRQGANIDTQYPTRRPPKPYADARRDAILHA